jgi:hypothetical protein
MKIGNNIRYLHSSFSAIFTLSKVFQNTQWGYNVNDMKIKKCNLNKRK